MCPERPGGGSATGDARRRSRASQRFWCDLLGFREKHARLDEGFAYLVLDDAHLMLDQASVSKTWITAALEAPLGRGVNFQLAVPNLETVLGCLNAAGWPLFGGVEERCHRAGKTVTGVRQILVQDPDGYLVRPQEPLSSRPVQA